MKKLLIVLGLTTFLASGVFAASTDDGSTKETKKEMKKHNKKPMKKNK